MLLLAKIQDVATKNMTREERKATRLKAWKRPNNANNRQTASDERKADWGERYGNTDSTDTSVTG